MSKQTPKQVVHEIRGVVDQLDTLVSAAQSVLPAPVRILVPLIHALRATVDAIDALIP